MITLKEYQIIANHIEKDISFGANGTFYIDDDDLTEYKFDKKEAKKTIEIMEKLLTYVLQSRKAKQQVGTPLNQELVENSSH